MNQEAERHAARARGYLAKGDELYRKAKPEIDAAHAAGATTRDLARYLARSHTWVEQVLAWDGKGALYGKDTEARQRRQAAQVLREAPLEQVERIVGSLPPERQAAIAAAAGHEYLRERQTQRPAEPQADEAPSAPVQRTRQAVGGFAALGLIGHLEQAADELDELLADASLTEETLRQIERVVERLVEKVAFGRQLIGGDRA